MVSIKYGSNFTESLDFGCVSRCVRPQRRAASQGTGAAGGGASGKTRSDCGCRSGNPDAGAAARDGTGADG
jgi:hypothetical protein